MQYLCTIYAPFMHFLFGFHENFKQQLLTQHPTIMQNAVYNRLYIEEKIMQFMQKLCSIHAVYQYY